MTALVLTVALPAAANAAPCESYSRTVTFADGSHRLAEGTACMDEDGVYRVTEEHLAPLSAPLPSDVYYEPPIYAPAPHYYPSPYAYYDPWYDPWYRPYYGPSLSFGFYSGHHHHHRHHH